MKRYTEYSQDELAALDDAGVQRLIDIELAHQGIAPVPAPEPPSLADVGIEKKDVGYAVGDLVFVNQADAEMVAKLPMLKEDYNYSVGWNYRWVEPKDDVAVQVRQYYKHDDITRMKGALVENKARQQEYDSLKKVYDKYLDSTSEVRNEVWNAVSAARKYMCEVESALHTFNHYKDLADGDESVATKFFRNNYQGRSDLIEAVLGSQPAPAEDAEAVAAVAEQAFEEDRTEEAAAG